MRLRVKVIRWLKSERRYRFGRGSAAEFGIGTFEQSFHVADGVGDRCARSTDHFGEMIANHGAVESHFTQRTHDLPHFHVAVIDKRFDEMRDGRADVAEVDLPQFPHAAEVADGAHHVHAHQFPALEPGSATKADADVRAGGDFERALVAFEVAEDATGHAAEQGHRRIIGMHTDEDALFFGYRDNLLNKVFVVIPDFLFRVDAAVRERTFEIFAGPVACRGVEVEGTGARAAARGFGGGTPDAVAHVSVRRVMQAGAAEVTQKILVMFDLLVAARKIERDFLHVVHVAVSDVPHEQTGGFDFVFEPDEILISGGLAMRGDIDVVRAELIDELQIFARWVLRHLHRDLDSRGPGMREARSSLRFRGHGSERGAEKSFAEFTAFERMFHGRPHRYLFNQSSTSFMW